MSAPTIVDEHVAGTAGSDATRKRTRTLPLKVRHAVLTAHIVFSVGLLGDSAGYLAVAIRTSNLDDPALVHDSARSASARRYRSRRRGWALRGVRVLPRS